MDIQEHGITSAELQRRASEASVGKRSMRGPFSRAHCSSATRSNTDAPLGPEVEWNVSGPKQVHEALEKKINAIQEDGVVSCAGCQRVLVTLPSARLFRVHFLQDRAWDQCAGIAAINVRSETPSTNKYEPAGAETAPRSDAVFCAWSALRKLVQF